METSELLRNITTLPIISSGLAEEMLAGNFRSVFKGQGMEFDEARHYEPGDDIRSIDWNASARFGTPFVKMYREERELTILTLLDISPSMHRGAARGAAYANYVREESGGKILHGRSISPYEQGLICAALIAFSAEHTDQQAGAFFFDSKIEKVFPPHKGRRHIMALIMAALRYQNKIPPRKDKHGSNIAAALAGAQRLLKKRSLVVVISDFFSINWEQEMAALCRKHDVIALRIVDPPDLPWQGLITLEDPETGVRIEAPAGTESFRESWSGWHKERSGHWENLCRRSGASFLELTTEADAPSSLLRFFGSRGFGTRIFNAGHRYKK
ncbi:MAG: DUF58 domain-containing protein [Treponema sp.]|jgi:uncharacterized protein (DUF58 family)|nr:DUF58 domain-containing protein [Treponema sp.]